MVVYYSIIVYTVAVSLFGAYVHNARIKDFRINDNGKTISFFLAIASVFLIVLFAGFRTRFADTPAYINWFNNASINFTDLIELSKDSKCIGFEFLILVFKKFISDNANAFLMFLAAFQGIVIANFYYKYSSDYAFSMFLFTASTEFLWMFNGIRQFTAVCIVLLFFDYVLQKKTFKFLLIVLVACTIHISAVVWIPVYFLVRFKPFSKPFWALVAIGLLSVFFIDNFTGLLDSALQGTAYDGMGQIMTNYTDKATGFVDDGVNFIRVIIAAIPSVLALIQKKYVDEFSNPLIDICINLSVVATGIYFVGVFTSGIIVGRLPEYFTLASYIVLPWIINRVYTENVKSVLKGLCIMGYIAYFLYVMVVQNTGRYESDILKIYLYN